MAKFKKGLSGILAFIMLCSAFVCSTVVTANAAAPTTMEKGTTYDFNFGSITGKNQYDVIVESGQTDVQIDGIDNSGYLSVTTSTGNIQYNSDKHGIFVSTASAAFSFVVPGNADISVGICQFAGEGNAAVEAEGGTVDKASFSAKSTDTEKDEASVSVKYTGSGGKITITMPAGSYLHNLSVKPEAEKEIPTLFASEWNFRSESALMPPAADPVEFNGKTGEVTDSVSGATLKIDATAPGAKWSTKSGETYRTDYVQINKGTIIGVPVDRGVHTISVEAYNADVSMTINGVDTVTNSSKMAYEIVSLDEAAYVPIVWNTNDFLSKITIKAETAQQINATVTGNESAQVSISFIDTLTNKEFTSLSASGSVSLLKGHTYKLKTNNSGYRALIDGSDTITIDTQTEFTIAVGENPSVELSGTITSKDGGTVNIESLQFVNMETGEKYDAVVTENKTYTASVKEGNYNTVAKTTNGYTTKNRVTVGSESVTDEEVFFVKPTSITYDLPSDFKSENKALTYSAGIGSNNETSITGKNGDTITVPVNGVQRVRVLGWYSGTWNINGQNSTTATQSANPNASNCAVCEYITNGTETTVTVNITASDVTTYLYQIKVEDYNPVTFASSITVSDTGDYKTLNDAVKAVKNMTDRPEGEAGRVTINLEKDTQEQVLIDVPYITLKGGEDQTKHTVSWYYGTTGIYYSVDANGYFDEELLHDKYETRPGNGTLWGGVVIVTGDYFKAENVIFKNTFNYEVTEAEKKDYAHQTYEVKTGTGDEKVTKEVDRTTADFQPTSYTYKERANALYTDAAHIECYNCEILSSQDTLGTNGQARTNYAAYFKKCKIGGNVDFICGGGNMVFDDCELELYGYPDSKNPSYITAAKNTKYLFRNCEVTANENGNPTDKATAYYGRPWEQDADVKFINTQTNDRIVAAGWSDMGTNTTAEAAKGFGEYANKAQNGSMFESTFDDKHMTDDKYEETVKDIVNDYLQGWTPEHYAAPIEDTANAPEASSPIGVVQDNSENLILYGQVVKTDAESVGFELSTKDNLFGKTYTGEGKVYNSLKYNDKSTSEEKTITAEDGKHLFAIVVSGVSGSDAATLYARVAQQMEDGTMVYGKSAEIDLSPYKSSVN